MVPGATDTPFLSFTIEIIGEETPKLRASLDGDPLAFITVSLRASRLNVTRSEGLYTRLKALGVKQEELIPLVEHLRREVCLCRNTSERVVNRYQLGSFPTFYLQELAYKA